MKSTEHFKLVIQAYLENRAIQDELFAEKFANPNKNIEDCVTYILNWVRESGYSGYTDEEIFSQAVHFYDEENIEVGKPINCKVIVNHSIDLTEEEKQEARQEAIKRVENEYYAQLTKKATKSKKNESLTRTPSLFD